MKTRVSSGPPIRVCSRFGTKCSYYTTQTGSQLISQLFVSMLKVMSFCRLTPPGCVLMTTKTLWNKIKICQERLGVVEIPSLGGCCYNSFYYYIVFKFDFHFARKVNKSHILICSLLNVLKCQVKSKNKAHCLKHMEHFVLWAKYIYIYTHTYLYIHRYIYIYILSIKYPVM